LSKKTVSVERTLSEEFDWLEVSVVGVKVQLGQTHSGITVCAEPDVVEKISTKVVDGTLVVRPKKDSSFSTDVAIQVSFSAPRLRGVAASAGARVDIIGLAGDSFEAEAASGAQVTARGSVVSLRGLAKSGGMVDLSKVSATNVSSQCLSGGVVRAG
jgi:putative autotransporter adhesin-like protein